MKHKTLERPRDVRFPHARRGELSYSDIRFPCLIQDVSARGLFIICARDPEIGQELGVSFELTPEHLYRCEIRVQHIVNGCFGAEIIAAGDQENKIYQNYVEKRFKALKVRRTTPSAVICKVGGDCSAQACLIECQWR
jgi:hypothetical protein